MILLNTEPPQKQYVVVGIIPIAIGVGIGVGVAGWVGIKAVEKILKIWEHQVTNSIPHLEFTVIEPLNYPE